MSAQILDCKKVVEAIFEECKKEVEDLKSRGITPRLGILRVGAKGPDLSYEKSAKKTMEGVGIDVAVYELPEDVGQQEYIEKIHQINDDETIHGILPFRPLDNIDENAAIGETIDAVKDVDSCTSANMGKLVVNDPTGLYPCTASAIMEIIDHYQFDVKGKDVVIVNNSNVIGKPVSMMLCNRFATITVCHEFTKDLEACCKKADMIICAVPVENLIKASYIKPGAIVIDATVIRKKAVDEEGNPVINEATGKQKIQIAGCCEDAVGDVAGWKTPVPGVGSITSALLAKNVVKACKVQNGLL